MKYKPLRIFVQVLLTLILIPVIIVFHVAVGLQPLSHSGFIQDYAKQIDLDAILESNIGGLSDTYEQTLDELVAQSGLEKEYIQSIINSEPVKEAVGTIVGSVVEFTLTGDESTRLDSADLINLVKDNMDYAIDIAAENGYTISNMEKSELIATIETELPKYEAEISRAYDAIDEMIDNGTITIDDGTAEAVDDVQSAKIVLEATRAFFNPLAIVAIAITAIIIAGLAALIRMRLSSGVFSLGLATLLASICILVPALASSFVISVLAGPAFEMLIPPLVAPLKISAIAGVIVGIVLLIVASILKKRSVTKQQETVTQEEAPATDGTTTPLKPSVKPVKKSTAKPPKKTATKTQSTTKKPTQKA